MGLARSTFYDAAPQPRPEEDVPIRIGAICDEFPGYGYRRVGAALRQQGIVVTLPLMARMSAVDDVAAVYVENISAGSSVVPLI